jgi:hypothetical protein
MKFKSFNVAELAAKRSQLKSLKEDIAFLVQVVKEEKMHERAAREHEKVLKLTQREYRKNERIAKMEARLAKLKSPKKPSKVKVYTGAEAQRLAA